MAYMNHEAGRDCLLELDSILHQLDISYFLMQGTALGAYRDKGFTPTERDIDIGILYENLAPNVPKLVHALLECRFDVEQFVMPFTRVRTVVAFKQYRGCVVKVDIVGMVRWKQWRFTCPPLRDYLEKPYGLVHEASLLEHYRETVQLWGRYFFLPKDIETYLTCEYGSGWKVPTENHVSRTRVYNFVELQGVPTNYLETFRG